MTDKIEVTQADRDAAQLVCEYFNWLTIPDEAVQIIARHAHAARIEGARDALEAAASYVDGKGDTVIPGTVSFTALVSGNNMPCMSGDGRDRMHPHIRRRFDDATCALADGIRALDPEQIVKGMSQ